MIKKCLALSLAVMTLLPGFLWSADATEIINMASLQFGPYSPNRGVRSLQTLRYFNLGRFDDGVRRFVAFRRVQHIFKRCVC